MLPYQGDFPTGSVSTVKAIRMTVVAALAALSMCGMTGQAQPPSQKQAPRPAAPAPKPAAPAAAEDEAIPAASPDALFPAVVARVNGKPVLGRDLEQRIRAQLAPMGNPPWRNLREDYRLELTTEALGSLVANELIYQRAVALGIKIAPADLQAEIAKVTKSFAGDAEMNVALANRGMDRASLAKEMERNLTVGRFISEQVTKKITVTPEEVAEYYRTHTEEFRHPDMVRTSHVLIMLPEGATAEQDRLARQRAEAILARARKGEDFAKLARENSMDPSASRGGDIGLVPRGQLEAAYEEAAFAQPVGGLAGPVRTRFGYHVIKVMDRKKEGLATLEEVRTELTDFLSNQKGDRQLGELVEQLRKEAKIEVYIPVGAPRPAAPTASSPRPQ